MAHPYDRLTPEKIRRPTSAKWSMHPDDVLPMWVADMDFPPAEAIREAVARFAREEHFMYGPRSGIPDLYESVSDHFAERFGWRPEPGHMQMVTGLVPGLFVAVRALTEPGESVLLPTPTYPPFLEAIRLQERGERLVEMPRGPSGYELDLEAMAAQVESDTRLLILCNPHNPTGRVFDRGELERVAEFVLEHDLRVISDEVHADLVYDGPHVPFASLSPEIAARTITVWGPTKAFNIAGLAVGFAIATDPELLERFGARMRGAVPGPTPVAQAASIAALRHGGDWLDGTVAYLKRNRDHVAKRVARDLPAARFTPPQGTYFAWLDLRAYELGDEPGAALLERAQVALNCGSHTGPGGEGFARLNFATSPAVLDEAFRRIRAALPTAAAD